MLRPQVAVAWAATSTTDLGTSNLDLNRDPSWILILQIPRMAPLRGRFFMAPIAASFLYQKKRKNDFL